MNKLQGYLEDMDGRLSDIESDLMEAQDILRDISDAADSLSGLIHYADRETLHLRMREVLADLEKRGLLTPPQIADFEKTLHLLKKMEGLI